jgi:excinuclease ABC subunit A
VLVVEHDLDVIAAADWVVDLGPGAADRGGRIVAAGPPAAVIAAPDSRTGRYLARHVDATEASHAVESEASAGDAEARAG